MERPSENAPAGYFHAWYSPSLAENTRTCFYKNDEGKRIRVSEVSEGIVPLCSKQSDLQYSGLVLSNTWEYDHESKLPDSWFDIDIKKKEITKWMN